MRNGIKFEDVMQVVDARPETVKIEPKKNFVKVYGPKGDAGPRLYIAIQKVCRQIDLSGFGKGWFGTIPLRAPNGAVEAHLDLGDPNALKHLAMLMEMIGRNEITVTEKQRVAPFVSSSPKAEKPADPKTTPLASLKGKEAAEARRALIEDTARRLGVKVSEKTEAELS